MKKIQIQRVSVFDIVVTLVLGVVFVLLSVRGTGELAAMQTTTQDYIQCEQMAKQLQDGSDYLVEQVRMYAATGDQILIKVAKLLSTTFRSIDYVCRIGGDEFAVIMVDVAQELDYTIRDKIAYINEELSNPKDDLPAVSLSAGVAFTDRANPGESIFKDADKALYKVKQNGRHGCDFY